MRETKPKFVPKGWGWEKWIVNKPEYCGKLLFFEEGKKSNLPQYSGLLTIHFSQPHPLYTRFIC
jgi:hypothetical protein